MTEKFKINDKIKTKEKQEIENILSGSNIHLIITNGYVYKFAVIDNGKVYLLTLCNQENRLVGNYYRVDKISKLSSPMRDFVIPVLLSSDPSSLEFPIPQKILETIEFKSLCVYLPLKKFIKELCVGLNEKNFVETVSKIGKIEEIENLKIGFKSLYN